MFFIYLANNDNESKKIINFLIKIKSYFLTRPGGFKTLGLKGGLLVSSSGDNISKLLLVTRNLALSLRRAAIKGPFVSRVDFSERTDNGFKGVR